MKVARTVYKYLVDNIGSPFGQIMSNCLYLDKELYRPASNDNVSPINYYNYSLFVIKRTQTFWLMMKENWGRLLLITSEDSKENIKILNLSEIFLEILEIHVRQICS